MNQNVGMQIDKKSLHLPRVSYHVKIAWVRIKPCDSMVGKENYNSNEKGSQEKKVPIILDPCNRWEGPRMPNPEIMPSVR